jgi:hypothetical protein
MKKLLSILVIILGCISCAYDFKDSDYWIIVEKSKYEYSKISEKTYKYKLEKYRKYEANNYFECCEYFYISEKSYEIGDTLFFNK